MIDLRRGPQRAGSARSIAVLVLSLVGCEASPEANEQGAIAGGGSGAAGSAGDLASAGTSGSAGAVFAGAGGLEGTGIASGGTTGGGGAFGVDAGGFAGTALDGSVDARASDASTVPRFRVFLLIGQSNMSGGAMPNADDLMEDDRIRVLGFDECMATGRRYNEWDTAAPPLHACWTNGIGPGDRFAKTLIEALPEGDTIGLIPSAFPGAGIDMFRKGVSSPQRDDFFIPPDDHWQGAYDWMVERARLAQEAGGVIEGIIFHQGETDNGQEVWVEKVQDMVEDLRVDLDLGPLPFIAGELLYGGCCQQHNEKVHMLPLVIDNASYVTTEDLVGIDAFHFDADGVRLLGQRYGEAMISALGLTH